MINRRLLELKAVVLVGCVSLSFFIPSIASAGEEQSIDVTQNPGCGVTLTTRAEKIARNERLAEYYFRGWNPAVMAKLGQQYRFEDHDCFSPEATYRMGYGLKPEPPALLAKPYRRAKDRSATDKGPFRTALPDWGTVPGTLRVHASENSCYFTMRFGGTTKDGQRIEYWEVDYIAVNDAGKITHWEGYNDTMGVDRLFRVVFGKSLSEIGELGKMPGHTPKQQ